MADNRVKVVMDLYPSKVPILFVERGGYMVIDWTTINPMVIDALQRSDVYVYRRSVREGKDYVIDLIHESNLQLHMAMHGQKMIRIRAPHGQITFKRRETNGKTEASSKCVG